MRGLATKSSPRAWTVRVECAQVDRGATGVIPIAGKFYEFHKERIISRPGAPVVKRPGLEVGPEILRAAAIHRLRQKGDVYTFTRQDAKVLATDAFPGRVPPTFEAPHVPEKPTPHGRKDVYFPHFHPGGRHPNDAGGLGHVFFSERGAGFEHPLGG